VRRDKGRRVEGRWKGGRGRESRRDEREGVMEMPIKIRVSASAHSTQLSAYLQRHRTHSAPWEGGHRISAWGTCMGGSVCERGGGWERDEC
jgi:hypothetical protein